MGQCNTSKGESIELIILTHFTWWQGMMKATVEILNFMSSNLCTNAFVHDVRDKNSASNLWRGLGLDSLSLAHCVEPESTAYSNIFLQIPIFETAPLRIKYLKTQ